MLVVIFIVAILVRRRRKQNREIARVEKKLDQGTAAAGLLNGQLTTTAGICHFVVLFALAMCCWAASKGFLILFGNNE